MTKRRTTKRALLSSVVALLLCFTMLLGSTFAWFTDSVSSARNTIQSGNLDVVLEYKTDWADDWAPVDGTTKLFKDGALYEPGYTEVVYLRVANEGNLALKYNLDVKVLGETKSTNVDEEPFALSDYLEIGTNVQDEYSSGFNYADILIPTMFGTRESALKNVTLTKLAEATGVICSDSPVLPGEQTAQVVTLVLTMPTTVGNEANHKTGVAAPTIDLGINLVATQYTHEEDSFDNQYDQEATYPDLPEPKDPALNPDDGSTPVNGDTYVDGDYTYTYDTDEGGWYVGTVGDTKKTSYGAILESINGEPVTLLYQTFLFCSNMTVAPKIPSSVEKLDMTFRSCSALETAPIIPDSVTSIVNAFQYCTSLTAAPVIPESVTSLNGAFNGCTALTTAPVIPSNVTRLYDTFSGCTALTGTITINTNKIDNNTGYFDGTCRQCFTGVDMTNITLTGAASKDVLNLIGATGNNWTPIQ